jgi:glycosyltransferase involved in cell wall biosynthesis
MIVKNERPVIARCLASVRPLIDTWVIVDTGSTDGTQDHIREVLAELPGELHERPWVDFAHNRSEALKLARGKADYVLIIDADEILEFEPDFVLPSLSADCYHFAIISGDYAYFKAQLVRDALPWRYEGVLHEYICCDQATREAELPCLEQNNARAHTAIALGESGGHHDDRRFGPTLGHLNHNKSIIAQCDLCVPHRVGRRPHPGSGPRWSLAWCCPETDR